MAGMRKKFEVPEGMKRCSKCREVKDLSGFHKGKKWCKECRKKFDKKPEYKPKSETPEQKERRRLRYKEFCADPANKEKIKGWKKKFKEENPEYYAKYREAHLEELRESNREYIATHKEEKATYDREYRKKNKAKIAENQKNFKERHKDNPLMKLDKSIMGTIWQALKGRKIYKEKFLECLPFTLEELKSHLEGLFGAKENLTTDGKIWMSWGNYGRYRVKTWDDNDSTTWTWNVDHIIPRSWLKYSSPEEENFQKCWALSNLRPYSAKQNNKDKDLKRFR